MGGNHFNRAFLSNRGTGSLCSGASYALAHDRVTGSLCPARANDRVTGSQWRATLACSNLPLISSDGPRSRWVGCRAYVADFGGDGSADIMTRLANGTSYVAYSHGDRFQNTDRIWHSTAATGTHLTGRFNSDLNSDLAAVGRTTAHRMFVIDPYSMWAFTQLPPPWPSGALADADGDGWNNFQEYAMGTNPRSKSEPGSQVRALFAPAPASGAECFSLEWPMRQDVLIADWRLEYSRNLRDWAKVSDVTGNPDGNLTRYLGRVFPEANDTHGFLRLSIDKLNEP
jgi:hypothetical protein